MKTIVLDIETIVDKSLWTPPEPDAFPPPYACKPIVLGYVEFDSDKPPRIGSIIGPEEFILRTLSEMAPGKNIVTWNGRRFDLPVLMLRSLRYGIGQSWYYTSRTARYRYSEDGHCDLADAMSDYGATTGLGLDAMARLIGLPGKVGDVTGASVGQAYAEGRIEAISLYCELDAVQTALLWLRWLHLRNAITPEACRLRILGLLSQCPETFTMAVDHTVLLP